MNEKREFERFSVNLTASYTEKTNRVVKHCTVREISRNGIRLQSIDKIEFGQELQLHIDSPRHFDAAVKVRWSKPVYTESGEEFLAGGALEAADPQAMQELIVFIESSD